MNKISLLVGFFVALCLGSCGYHLGGLRNGAMKNVDTFCVEMFENRTTHAMVSMQMTTAVADALQRDGTFRLASPSTSDVRIEGVVTNVASTSLITDYRDSYISAEIGLRVFVSYKVIDCRTNKVLISGTTEAEGSFFNSDSGNVQTARDAALSYATRKAATNIVNRLTIP
ncbi:MAG: hypothetical protein IJB31_03555 [Akkermansia sp.]|nr:hypothetical protein [Akkermansia sp.]